MTTNVLRDVISDLILEHVTINIDRGSVYVSNSDALADLILKRIQETHFISERSLNENDWPDPKVPKPVDPAAMDRIGEKIAATKASASWAGQVDRQGGSFSDQEIADSYTWR